MFILQSDEPAPILGPDNHIYERVDIKENKVELHNRWSYKKGKWIFGSCLWKKDGHYRSGSWKNGSYLLDEFGIKDNSYFESKQPNNQGDGWFPVLILFIITIVFYFLVPFMV
jgi:hypothetical protein